MQVLGRHLLENFKRQHPQARKSLDAWLQEAIEAKWTQWADIKARYPSADWLSGNRVVFNIKGNDYRLLVLVTFSCGVVKVERVGTHADYDKWKL